MNRVVILDVLRGFSLFGLLLVHLPILGIAEFVTTDHIDPQASLPYKIAYFIYYTFSDGRFFPIFAFLFGYGFSLQLSGKVGENPKIFLRRLLGLAILGLMHNVLFFNGDILFSYACIGLILFFLRNASDKTLAALVLIGLVISSITYFMIGDYAPSSAEIQAQVAEMRHTNQVGFWSSVLSRVDSAPMIFGFILLFNWPSSFAMLCLGFLLGRKGIFTLQNPFEKVPSWFYILAISLGLGGGILASLHDFFHISRGMSMAIFGLTAPLLSFIYIYLMQRGYNKFPDFIAFRLLSQAGKMSLTIYLLESVTMATFFQAWGFGQFEKFSLASVMLLAIPFYLLLVGFAKLWFLFFDIGPMEGLLRSVSYLQKPKWRK
jgi:uncharacterized protein